MLQTILGADVKRASYKYSTPSDSNATESTMPLTGQVLRGRYSGSTSRSSYSSYSPSRTTRTTRTYVAYGGGSSSTVIIGGGGYSTYHTYVGPGYSYYSGSTANVGAIIAGLVILIIILSIIIFLCCCRRREVHIIEEDEVIVHEGYGGVTIHEEIVEEEEDDDEDEDSDDDCKKKKKRGVAYPDNYQAGAPPPNAPPGFQPTPNYIGGAYYPNPQAQYGQPMMQQPGQYGGYGYGAPAYGQPVQHY